MRGGTCKENDNKWLSLSPSFLLATALLLSVLLRRNLLTKQWLLCSRRQGVRVPSIGRPFPTSHRERNWRGREKVIREHHTWAGPHPHTNATNRHTQWANYRAVWCVLGDDLDWERRHNRLTIAYCLQLIQIGNLSIDCSLWFHLCVRVRLHVCTDACLPYLQGRTGKDKKKRRKKGGIKRKRGTGMKVSVMRERRPRGGYGKRDRTL